MRAKAWAKVTEKIILYFFACLSHSSSCEFWTDELRLEEHEQTNERTNEIQTSVGVFVLRVHCAWNSTMEYVFNEKVIHLPIFLSSSTRHTHTQWPWTSLVLVSSPFSSSLSISLSLSLIFLRFRSLSVHPVIHSTFHLNHLPHPFQFDARHKLFHLFTSTLSVCHSHSHTYTVQVPPLVYPAFHFGCYILLWLFLFIVACPVLTRQSVAADQIHIHTYRGTDELKWMEKKRRYFSMNVE